MKQVTEHELAARRAFIKKFRDPDAQLDYWERAVAAQVMEEAWLPKTDHRQMRLDAMEMLLCRVKPGLKSLTKDEREAAFDMLAVAYGHASGPALNQWLKRERAARKRGTKTR